MKVNATTELFSDKKWRIKIIPTVYFLSVLLVFTPLLPRGYILTSDLVFTPNYKFPNSLNNSYLFNVLLHYLSLIIPTFVLEKLILIAILLLCSFGMYVLLKFIYQKTDIYQDIGICVAGVIFMINPFTYDRFMAGQYEVLLGYALLPWFVRTLLLFINKPEIKTSTFLIIWILLVSILSIHAIGYILIISIVAILLKVYKNHKNKEYVYRLLKYGILSLAVFVFASSYWFIPLLFGHGSISNTLSSFNSTDESAFVTLGGNIPSRIFDVICLQGFWQENTGLYNLPQNAVPLWGLITILVWVFVITGGINLWKNRHKFLVVLMSLSSILAILLSVGLFNSWITSHVPLFAGYREPQKFVSILALTYAVFISAGIAAALKYIYKIGGKVILVFFGLLTLILPFIWTPTMVWGFNNQLTPVQYPNDWYTVNDILNKDKSKFSSLFLPWHLYMSYFFDYGRIISSPAPQFFDKPVIASNDPEYKGIPPLKNNEDNTIAKILQNPSASLPAKLAVYHIKYIILARDLDFYKYSYLNTAPGLKLVFSSPTMDLYLNEAFGK